MKTSGHTALLPALNDTVENLIQQFGKIPEERKRMLTTLAAFISKKTRHGERIYLNFICTHNSRRSHIAQLWAQAAARYYGVSNVHTFSGGTEATAFNQRAVKAIADAGFNIDNTSEGDNPVYTITFSKETPPIKAFSKKYDDPLNPRKDFAAVMTCGHADENCPLIPGAAKRFAVTYDDPKDFDNTPQEENKYRERVMQIGREMLFAFSMVG